MDIHTAMEESYKNGYKKGYEDGRREAVKVGRWIPVKERLPKSEEVALCLIKNGEQDILQFDRFENLWIGRQWTYKRHAITHWMPLPESPKEY